MTTPDLTPLDDFGPFTALGYRTAPEVVLTAAALSRYRTGEKPSALTRREPFNARMRVTCAREASAALCHAPTHPAYPSLPEWPNTAQDFMTSFEAYLALAPETPFTRYAHTATGSDRRMCAYAWANSLPLVGPDFQELDPTEQDLQ